MSDLPEGMGLNEANVTKSYNDPIVATEYFNEMQIRDLTSHLVGDVLTIVDATMEDPIRRKAVKDLVVNRLWDANWRVIDWMKAGGKEEDFPFRMYAFNPKVPRKTK